jgi:hypothetical protein
VPGDEWRIRPESVDTIQNRCCPRGEQPIDLRKRGGIYYARLRHLQSGELFEVALHGVLSDEQARAAVKVLIP